jgi:hypothetical protein
LKRFTGVVGALNTELPSAYSIVSLLKVTLPLEPAWKTAIPRLTPAHLEDVSELAFLMVAVAVVVTAAALLPFPSR